MTLATQKWHPSHLQPFVESQNMLVLETLNPPDFEWICHQHFFFFFTFIPLHSDLKTACSLTRYRPELFFCNAPCPSFCKTYTEIQKVSIKTQSVMGDQSVAWAVVIRKNRAVGESGGGYDVCRARQHRRSEEGSWGLLKIETRGRGGGHCAKSDVGRKWESTTTGVRALDRKTEGTKDKGIHKLLFKFILRMKHILVFPSLY